MNFSSGSTLISPSSVFAFGDCRLEADGTLNRSDHTIHLPPQELAALRLLLERAGSVVTPAQLKQGVWGDVHVSGDSILHCISSLRARLGDQDRILTVYKRGYRFAGPVHRIDAPPPHQPRLAIVPFACGPDVAADLSELVAEEAAASLTAFAAASVSVIARDSVFMLARRGLTAQQIGESLQADFVLTGTIRAMAANLRVRAEMIYINEGAQIWVEDVLVSRDAGEQVASLLVSRIAFRFGAAVGPEAERNE